MRQKSLFNFLDWCLNTLISLLLFCIPGELSKLQRVKVIRTLQPERKKKTFNPFYLQKWNINQVSFQPGLCTCETQDMLLRPFFTFELEIKIIHLCLTSTSLPPSLHIELALTFSFFILNYRLIDMDPEILKETFNMKDRDKTTTLSTTKKEPWRNVMFGRKSCLSKNAHTQMYKRTIRIP